MKRMLLRMIFFILLAGCTPGTTSPAPETYTSPTASPVPTSLIPTGTTSSMATAPPIDPALFQGWWTYTNSTYDFSLRLPEDWTAEEAASSDALLNGHLVIFNPSSGEENIRMTFRRQGEDTPLWPSGVGQGDFIPQGALEIAGEPALRVLLVCPTGEVTAIWYHQAEAQANIVRDGLEFGFIFTAGVHCKAGQTLTGKTQQVGEMIIASLKLE